VSSFELPTACHLVSSLWCLREMYFFYVQGLAFHYLLVNTLWNPRRLTIFFSTAVTASVLVNRINQSTSYRNALTQNLHLHIQTNTTMPSF